MAEERRAVGPPPPDLELGLRQLARQLDVSRPPDYATRVQQRLRSSPATNRSTRWRRAFGVRGPLRRLAAAAIVLLLATAVVVSVPATRAAVADLFGFAGVNVRTAPSTASSPRTTLDAALDLGERVTLDQAQSRVTFPISVPTIAGLDAPDAVYARRERGLESVSLVYRPTAELPATNDRQVGMLVSQYLGSATPYFDKIIDAGEPVTQVTLDGQWPGLYFTSPHQILVRAPDGLVHEDSPRLAAPTLIWVRDNVTYRLEAALDLEQALAVAESMRGDDQ